MESIEPSKGDLANSLSIKSISGIRELIKTSGILFDSVFYANHDFYGYFSDKLQLLPEPNQDQLNEGVNVVSLSDIEESHRSTLPSGWNLLWNDLLTFAPIVDQPPPRVQSKSTLRTRTFRARKIDFASSDSKNRKLGWSGEEFVLEYERYRLIDLGRPDLSERIVHIAKTLGDGAGYDILSFELDGGERYIEVKSTNGPKDTPFHLTSNELEFSRQNPKRFHLYRVFGLKSSPRIFIISGDLTKYLSLTPVSFRASFDATE